MQERRYLRKSQSLRKSHLYLATPLKLNHCLEIRLLQLQVETSLAVIRQHKEACLEQSLLLVIHQVTCSEANHLKTTLQPKVGCLDLSRLKVIRQHQGAYSGLNLQVETCLVVVSPQKLRKTVLEAYLEEINLQQDLYSVVMLHQQPVVYLAVQHLQHQVVYSVVTHLAQVFSVKQITYSRRNQLHKMMMKRKRVRRERSLHPIMPLKVKKSS